MKKILCCLLFICLCACEKEEIIFAPSTNELGNICTIVSEFDKDIYNISLFYTENENYPILNKDDFNYINQIGLKHSSEGSKDVNKYKINQKNAYKLCNLEDANVVNVAIQIPDSSILKFMSELRNYTFHYEVEKEGQVFKVEMPNNIITTTDLEINYSRVYSQKLTQEEIEALKLVNFEESYNISLDSNRPILVNSFVGERIGEENSRINQTFGLGEVFQILGTLTFDENVDSSNVPILTLVKILKSDIDESTYVIFDDHYYMTSELSDYILYETEDAVIYDLNKYIYEIDIQRIIEDELFISTIKINDYEINTFILDKEVVDNVYNLIKDKVKEVIK